MKDLGKKLQDMYGKLPEGEVAVDWELLKKLRKNAETVNNTKGGDI